MKEIIRELDIALSRIQSIKFEGTYSNVKNQADAIEALLRAGEMLKAMDVQPTQDGPGPVLFTPVPVPFEPEPEPEIEAEVEEVGNE